MNLEQLASAISDTFHFGNDRDRLTLVFSFVREIAEHYDTLPAAFKTRLAWDPDPIGLWQVREAIGVLENIETSLS
jgi:hypothetical protein